MHDLANWCSCSSTEPVSGKKTVIFRLFTDAFSVKILVHFRSDVFFVFFNTKTRVLGAMILSARHPESANMCTVSRPVRIFVGLKRSVLLQEQQFAK